MIPVFFNLGPLVVTALILVLYVDNERTSGGYMISLESITVHFEQVFPANFIIYGICYDSLWLWRQPAALLHHITDAGQIVIQSSFSLNICLPPIVSSRYLRSWNLTDFNLSINRSSKSKPRFGCWYDCGCLPMFMSGYDRYMGQFNRSTNYSRV